MEQIYALYAKAIMYIYIKYMKQYKKEWNKILVRQYAKKFYQNKELRRKMFFFKKMLFKQIKTGTLKNIKYWKKLIKLIATKHSILSDRLPDSPKKKTEGVKNANEWSTSLKPYILLQMVLLCTNKPRTTIINKIKTYLYKLTAFTVTKTKRPHRKKQRKKKWVPYWLLFMYYALINKKKKYIMRDSFYQKRVNPYIGRINKKILINNKINTYLNAIATELIFKKRVAPLLLIFQNGTSLPFFKALKMLATKRHKKEEEKKKKEKNKKNKRKKQRKPTKILWTTHKLYMKREKRRKLKLKRKIRFKWRFKVNKMNRRSAYFVTCPFYTDYLSYWIDEYKNRNRYKKTNKNLEGSIQHIKQRRYYRLLKKLKRYTTTSQYIIHLKSQYVAQEAVNAFPIK